MPSSDCGVVWRLVVGCCFIRWLQAQRTCTALSYCATLNLLASAIPPTLVAQFFTDRRDVNNNFEKIPKKLKLESEVLEIKIKILSIEDYIQDSMVSIATLLFTFIFADFQWDYVVFRQNFQFGHLILFLGKIEKFLGKLI